MTGKPSTHCSATLPDSIYQITPGTQLLLTFAGLDERLKTAFVGQERGKYFLFRTPKNAAGFNLYEYLYPGATATIRYLHAGNIWGFSAPVQSYLSNPYPVVFTDFPERIDSLNLRKEHRIECYFPVSALINTVGHKGVIVDISCAGCQLHYDASNSGESLDIGDVFKIQIPVFGAAGKKSLSCQVKCTRETGNGKLAVGTSFINVDPDVSQCIKDYISQVTNLLRS